MTVEVLVFRWAGQLHFATSCFCGSWIFWSHKSFVHLSKWILWASYNIRIAIEVLLFRTWFGVNSSKGRQCGPHVAFWDFHNICSVIFAGKLDIFVKHQLWCHRYITMSYRRPFIQAVLETAITESHVLVRPYPICMNCQWIALLTVKPLDISTVTTCESTLGIQSSNQDLTTELLSSAPARTC